MLYVVVLLAAACQWTRFVAGHVMSQVCLSVVGPYLLPTPVNCMHRQGHHAVSIHKGTSVLSKRLMIVHVVWAGSRQASEI